MKKLIPLLILLGGAASGFAQGTVSFHNFDVYATTDPAGRLVYTAGSPLDPVNGTGLAGLQWVAELYSGTSAGSLTPITASISRFRASTTLNKGKWGTSTLAGLANNPTILPGTAAGDVVFLQVKVWDFDANGGATSSFETAAGNKGQSAVFTYKVPVPTAPSGDFFMENLQGFALVPEPSAIALGIMGVAGLLLVRRRK